MMRYHQSALKALGVAWLATCMPGLGGAQNIPDFVAADQRCNAHADKCVSTSTLYRLLAIRVGKDAAEIGVSIEEAADQLARVLPTGRAPDTATIIQLNHLDGATPDTLLPRDTRLRVLE